MSRIKDSIWEAIEDGEDEELIKKSEAQENVRN